LALDEHFVEMFLNEARLAARLQHDNIAQIFELAHERGQHFIVMEHVDGPSLKQLCGTEEAPRTLSVERAATVAWYTCRALSYAHEFCVDGKSLCVIHRDVTPENILLSTTGSLKLIDFGIAKAADQNDNTRTGVLKGKLSYLSPEQLADKPLDHRADIFVLGIVMYQMLTGHHPFRAESRFETLRRIMSNPPSPMGAFRSDLPEALVEVIQSCLAKDPQERPANCGALQDVLERVLSELKVPVSTGTIRLMVEEHLAEQSAIAALEEPPPAKAPQPTHLAHPTPFPVLTPVLPTEEKESGTKALHRPMVAESYLGDGESPMTDPQEVIVTNVVTARRDSETLRIAPRGPQSSKRLLLLTVILWASTMVWLISDGQLPMRSWLDLFGAILP